MSTPSVYRRQPKPANAPLVSPTLVDGVASKQDDSRPAIDL
jgi:hypothetical protein